MDVTASPENVSREYHNYVVYLNKYYNEQAAIIEKNTANIAEHVGDNNVFVKFFGEGVDDFCATIGIEFRELTAPAVVVVDKHPADITDDDRCLLFEVGAIDDSSEVTRILEVIFSKLNDDEFNELAWIAKRRQLENALDTVDLGAVGSISIGLLSV